MKMGMKKNDSPRLKFSTQELQLIEQLREHPLLLERFQAILAITANAAGPMKSADEVAGLLIEETRRLGNTPLGSWAARAEQRLAEQLEQKDDSAGGRKKNAGVVVRFRSGERAGTGLAHRRAELSAPVAPGH